MAGFREKKRRNETMQDSMDNMNVPDEFLEKVSLLASYYRQFPHVFAKDYLGVNLYDFQKVLLYSMMHNNYYIFIATRNLGKTYLCAVYMATRCILYPHTKVIICSGNKSQAVESITKVKELMTKSENLRREIKFISDSVNTGEIEFWNGSRVRIVASNAGSRSKRANLIIVDEYVLVDDAYIEEVARPMLGDPRSPRYLNNPKYRDDPKYDYLREPDTEIYMSSAGFQWHESYKRFESYFEQMLMPNSKYFVCDLSYTLAVYEGLRRWDFYNSKRNEKGCDVKKFEREYCGLFTKESSDAFYKHSQLNSCRKLLKPLYPKNLLKIINEKDKGFIDMKKVDGEVRVLACDIAMVGLRRNDASAYSLIRAIPISREIKTVDENGNQIKKVYKFYERQLVYMETMEGGTTSVQANRIKQLQFDLDADYVVLDVNNAGISILDLLMSQSVDMDTGKDFPAFTIVNPEERPELAVRCQYKNAMPIVYPMSAYADANDKMAKSLQYCITEGLLKMLVDRDDAKPILSKIKNYDSIDSTDMGQLLKTYDNVTFLINEMIALKKATVGNGLLKLKESGSSRKDRYSSVLYGNAYIDMLEESLNIEESKFEFNEEDIVCSYIF